MFHLHFWHLVGEKNRIREMNRWDGVHMTIEILIARFVCRCGETKEVFTDQDYKDGTWRE